MREGNTSSNRLESRTHAPARARRVAAETLRLTEHQHTSAPAGRAAAERPSLLPSRHESPSLSAQQPALAPLLRAAARAEARLARHGRRLPRRPHRRRAQHARTRAPAREVRRAHPPLPPRYPNPLSPVERYVDRSTGRLAPSWLSAGVAKLFNTASPQAALGGSAGGLPTIPQE